MAVKRPRQRVAKKPVAKVTPTVKGPKKVKRPGKARNMEEPAPAIRDSGGRREKRENQGGLGTAKGTRKPTLAIEDLEEGRKTGEPAPVAALSLFCFEYWQTLTLAAACFRHCFFFFNCQFFSQRCSLSLSLLLSTAIASLISPALPQSALVHPSQSVPFQVILGIKRTNF